MDTEEEELQYLYSLGATDSVLSDLAFDTDHDNFVVCAQPFIALENSSSCAVSVPVTFGGNTVTYHLRKSLSDGSWWITEEGTVSGSISEFVERFMLNSYKHLSSNWMYVIVSPYEYSEDLSDALKRQCIAHSSLLIRY